MISLTPDECRALGVLIEKAQTTPQQYPLTLNALVNGANQKNNREPVTNLDEDKMLTAVDGLRAKGLTREVSLSGSRVAKFRHTTREALEISTSELVILAELLLRGPQTVGELRGRASRMHPLESLEVVESLLKSLMGRAEPLLREVGPSAAPGSRAARYAQLLCPDLHPLDAPAAVTPARSNSQPSALSDRVDQLESEVAALRGAIQSLALSLGEPDPMKGR
jgi:uncharacterized protein YceH (UPF0502 family)